MERKDGLDYPSLLYWGDPLSVAKQPQTFRIAFVNIRGFGKSADLAKNKQFSCFDASYAFDVIGTAENNVNWRQCSVKDRPYECYLRWWHLRHVSYAYSSRDKAMSGFFIQQEALLSGFVALWFIGLLKKGEISLVNGHGHGFEDVTTAGFGLFLQTARFLIPGTLTPPTINIFVYALTLQLILGKLLLMIFVQSFFGGRTLATC